MRFTLLTYNVLFNRGYEQIGLITAKYKPDIICLQEVETSEVNLKILEDLGYKLADFANSFIQFGKIYGIATFYNPRVLNLIESNSIFLPRSIYEFLLTVLKLLHGGQKPRTILETRFICRGSKSELIVYNTHLTIYGSNSLRLKQIKEAIDYYNIDNYKRVIITGDFNYMPYGRKSLERLMEKYNLNEATKNIRYTIKYTPVGKLIGYNFVQRLATRLYTKLFSDRIKIDYIFYKELKLIKTKRINVRYSDHYPVMSWFQI